MRLNFKQILQFTGGSYIIEPIDASRIIVGMTWDSRDVDAGCLFVALPGENVDGHDYVHAALKAGAACILVNEAPDAASCLLARELGAGIIEVPNTYHAIEDLAVHWRGFLNAKVIAITGSVGKTTTKNLVRDVCAAQLRTQATSGNQNNELGVPNTILSADPDTQVLVVEMGMRGHGQISKLCSIAKPDWGIVTNVGECHLELLGTKEAIAQAKGELLCALPDGSGKAIMNADDSHADAMVEGAALLKRRVGLEWYGSSDAVRSKGSLEGAVACSKTVGSPNASADAALKDGGMLLASSEAVRFSEGSGRCWHEGLELDGEGRATFTLCAQGFLAGESNSLEPSLFDMEPGISRVRCSLAVRGAHNVQNACAAACVGLSLGMSIDDVAQALSESLPETGRLETCTARDGYLVINDAYNANPDSMRAALRMLCGMSVLGRRVAVLGDMGELGVGERECHRGVGREAAAAGVDLLVCIGALSCDMAHAAREAGMPAASVKHVDSIGEALELLEGNLSSDDAVLVKASHFMRLDRLVEGLVS